MDIKIKRIVRKAAGAHSNCRVEVIDGQREPMVAGLHGHYRTKAGDFIRHPSAYSRRGWSNMVYVASTVRVVVGQDWINSNNDKETK